LYGRETYTMEGDPSIPVIVDSWLKGLRGFDINKAYEAMRKGATTPGAKNKLRPDNDDYMKLGYVPLREQYDNSVSHALEYYIADNALSRLAKALGKDSDAKLFYNRSLGYKHYYSKEYGTFRPILPSGKFYSPFNPLQGENFEPNPGFHEGNAWNYTFYVPHDIKGLTQLMGGSKAFVDKFKYAHILGSKMTFDDAVLENTVTPEAVNNVCRETMRYGLIKASAYLRSYERKFPGSICFLGSQCLLCGNKPCTRLKKEACRHPNDVRVSLEAVGFDLGKTTQDLLGIELKWGKPNRLPQYITLVTALFTNDATLRLE